MIKRNFTVLQNMILKMDKNLIKEDYSENGEKYKYAIKAPFESVIRFATVSEISDWIENELLKNDVVWNVPESKMSVYYRREEMRK